MSDPVTVDTTEQPLTVTATEKSVVTSIIGASAVTVNVTFGGGRGPIWLDGSYADSTILAQILAGAITKQQLSVDLNKTIDDTTTGLASAEASLADAINQFNATGETVDQLSSQFTQLNDTLTLQAAKLEADDLKLTSAQTFIDDASIQLTAIQTTLTNTSNYIAAQQTLYANEWNVKIQENNDGTAVVAGVGLLVYPDWTLGTIYDVGTYVWYSNNAYKCLIAHTATNDNKPGNVTYWEYIPFATKSQFGVLADSFFVQSASGDQAVPFMVYNDEVIVNADMIVNGLISAGALSAREVFAWSVQSPNYVAGQSGYKLDATTGTVEFNDYNVTVNASDIDYNYLMNVPTSLADIDVTAANVINNLDSTLQTEMFALQDYTDSAVLDSTFAAYKTWNYSTEDCFSDQTGEWNNYSQVKIESVELLEDTVLLEDTLLLGDISYKTWFEATGLSIQGSVYYTIRVRLKQLVGVSVWGLRVYYKTANHEYSDNYYIEAPAISTGLTDFFTVELDMSTLTQGSTDWIDNIITDIRIDIATIEEGSWDIDWIVLGFNGIADVTSMNTSANTLAVGNTAAEIVENNAASALDSVENMESDSIFSISEKLQWQIQWPGMQSNYETIFNALTDAGISTTPLKVARDDLYNYLNLTQNVFSSTLINSPITQGDLTTLVSTFYSQLAYYVNVLSDAIATTKAAAAQAAAENTAITLVNNIDPAAIINTKTTTIQGGKIATGSITTYQIAANTIIGNNIAANTITGNEIAAQTLSAWHIQTNSITADKIATKTITAASGVIGDLAVNTLQIANRAVTIPAFSYAADIVAINATPQSRLTHTISTTGQPVCIQFGVFFKEGGEINIYRDGSSILAVTANNGIQSFATIDIPSAGTHTYNLYISGANGTSIVQRFILTIETKR